MPTDDSQFGRQRVRRPKPQFGPGSETPPGEIQEKLKIEEPQPEQKKIEPVPEQSPVAPVVEDTKPQVKGEVSQSEPHMKPKREPYLDRKKNRREERKPDRFPQSHKRRENDTSKPPERQVRKFQTDKSKIRISVIIPAYNEESNIKPLLDQFHEIIGRAGSDWEVIIVDDGSTDRTAERARDAAIHYHWLRVVSYSRNRGLTAALNTGFQSAKGSIFVFYPADLQYHPQDIPKMINRIDRGADVVTGWKQGKYQKRLVSFVYNRICRMLFNVKVHDLNSVKAFRREVLDKINMRQDWHRYMVVLAAEQGYSIDEVKVAVYPRHSGESKFKTGRILGGVLDLLSVKFQISFTKKPLRFFGTWGLVSILLGVITGFLALYLRYFTTHGSRTWLYLVILFVLSGLMLFSLGFLAEVIVAIREEIEALRSKNRLS